MNQVRDYHAWAASGMLRQMSADRHEQNVGSAETSVASKQEPARNSNGLLIATYADINSCFRVLHNREPSEDSYGVFFEIVRKGILLQDLLMQIKDSKTS